MYRRHKISAALLSLSCIASAHASCGSSACAINTNWDEHSTSKPGLSMDLRYSYSKADQLRSGNSKINADTTFNGEVENLSTVNRITTATIDYAINEHWGAMLVAPFIARDHSHNLGPYTGSTPAGSETFTANALGDVKLIGRYRWELGDSGFSSAGLKLGMKLNTGRQDTLIVDNLGNAKLPTEVTLQTGSGSTDLVAGAFWQLSDPASSASWFAQAMAQSAINNRADFRPGNQYNLDAGMRYAFNKSMSGLLQLNSQWNAADSGSSAALTPAGSTSSGGTSVLLAPGMIYAIAADTNLYGLVQIPLYHYVNGEQLTVSQAFALGINHRF